MNLSQLIGSVGYRLVRLSEALKQTGLLDLSGDRDVEWAWIAGNLPERPGRVLDFGPSTSLSGLVAAFHGGKVTGLDLEPPPPPRYAHQDLAIVQGDILVYDFGDRRFDTVINCSTVEHVGLPGRYGNPDIVDGDLQAMRRLRSVMAGPHARMLMTVPVGIDGVFAPAHRVYGNSRLPRLIVGFSVVRESYFAKLGNDRCWRETTRELAMAVQGSATYYALGLYVLAPI